MYSTHDERVIPCETSETLSQLSDICNGVETAKFKGSKLILINEGQFFSDIKEWVSCAVEKYNKHVYICGLDGDFRRNKFGDLLDLIPLCDEVIKLKSICVNCKVNHAIFTHRHIKDDTDQILIGTDEYNPLCRSCYKDLNK